MKRLFLIKRKGFNFYTDYTELYLHKSFENKGYYLVKEKNKCLFDVIVDICDNEKYMVVLSSHFDSLSEEDALEFTEILSANFKSEVITIPYTKNYELKGTLYKFMFSDTYSAFEEDAYVYDQNPELVREVFSPCISQRPYVINYTNYGGAFRGLEIELFFDGDDVELEEATFNYFQGKDKIAKEIIFEKNSNVFKCKLEDFFMDKGINKYSAVLRGKKKENEKCKHSFYIRFIPKSDAEILVPNINVKPI